jgi:DNA-binding response OmpR family regulator
VEKKYSMTKILIIDDDEVLLKLLSTALAEEGYSPLTTADGPQGLVLYQVHRPSLVLLDLGLPSMSGIEVLREIRQFDEKAKVIVVTGYGSVESAVVAIRYGAWDYVQKPIDMEVLLKKMEMALRVAED